MFTQIYADIRHSPEEICIGGTPFTKLFQSVKGFLELSAFGQFVYLFEAAVLVPQDCGIVPDQSAARDR